SVVGVGVGWTGETGVGLPFCTPLGVGVAVGLGLFGAAWVGNGVGECESAGVDDKRSVIWSVAAATPVVATASDALGVEELVASRVAVDSLAAFAPFE
ncbi:MAG TPA: hypothetical protein VF326_14325, partial [Anaerolineaceae bacterium]